MNNQELKNKLHELKGRYNSCEPTVIRIEHLIDLIDRIPDSAGKVMRSVEYFFSICDTPSLLETNLNGILDSLIEEAHSYIKSKQKHIQKVAIVEMRTSRKGFVIAAIVILSFIAGVATVLGVLGAIGKISGSYCDIVGVADCTLGIIFFIYELYSDKLNESKINSGDEDTIKKYTKQIPIHIDQQVSVGSQVINGTVYGNVIMNSISNPTEIDDIISKLFSDQ